MEKPKEKPKITNLSEGFLLRNQPKFISRHGKDVDDYSDIEKDYENQFKEKK